MNIINISNAPAYTSPNSMTLICTEKPDGSTNFATLAGCGTCSGRDTDKAAKVGLTMQEVEATNIKAPVPCKLLIHATVAQTMDADDHVVHLCDVKGVYGDEDVDAVFGWKGYAEFAAAQQK